MGCGATDEYWDCEREAQVFTSLAASQRPSGVADDQVGGGVLLRSLADFFLATLGADFSSVRLHVDGHAPAAADAAAPTAGKLLWAGCRVRPERGPGSGGLSFDLAL